MINMIIDLGYLEEHYEQGVWEFSVSHVIEELAHVMPLEFIRLMHQTHGNSDDYSRLPDENAESMEESLVAHCMATVPLPFIDGRERRRERRETEVSIEITRRQGKPPLSVVTTK